MTINTNAPDCDVKKLVNSQENSSMSEPDDSRPWYALKVYISNQRLLYEALKERQMECFIPMEYADDEVKSEADTPQLRPIVRNLLFLKKTKAEHEIKELLNALPYKLSVIKKEGSTSDCYEIPASQMVEFQAMCNPDILSKKFISAEEAKLKAGTPVIVTHGPLKGLNGRLVRSNKKYYLLKEVPGIGVMLKVSRWCCRPLPAE